MSPKSNKLNSAIYTGWVRHRRYEPRPHAFKYTMYQLFLDLDELDTVFKGSWLWSTKRPAIAWFRRKDHFGDPSKDLSICIRDLIETETGSRPAGPIRLLTHLRYFGMCMNPVSFYYVYSEDSESEILETVVAEVHNTPWGERHCYVLPRTAQQSDDMTPHEFEKIFHVSPFMPMNQRYKWQLSDPTQQLVVHMENEQLNTEEQERVFDATMVLHRKPLNARTRARVLIQYPLMTLKVVLAIYWQAFRLWIKRVPFHSHPKKATV